MRKLAELPRTPKDLYEEVLLSPIDWPLKTTRVQKHSVSDYRQRSLSPNVSVAELYHANSKYFPSMASEVGAASIDPASLRADFVKRRSALLRRSKYTMLKVDPAWQALLSSLAHPALVHLYYTCEVRIIVNATIGILEPTSAIVYVAKTISGIHLDILKGSTAVLGNNDSGHVSFPLIAVVASFARNDLLFGARGYRHALMEAGQLCREIIRAGAANGINLECYLEFTDTDVDRIMECDGLEECVVALLCLRVEGLSR